MVNRLHIARARAWLIPLVYAVAVVTLGVTSSRLAHVLLPKLVSTISVNAAIGIYSSVASGMLSLTGIVYSLTFVIMRLSIGNSGSVHR